MKHLSGLSALWQLHEFGISPTCRVTVSYTGKQGRVKHLEEIFSDFPPRDPGGASASRRSSRVESNIRLQAGATKATRVTKITKNGKEQRARRTAATTREQEMEATANRMNGKRRVRRERQTALNRE